MNYFKPIDEMSLRHLFASDLGESILNMVYIGPVLNPGGSIESSPDSVILDRRNGDWKLKKCEFKYFPNSKEDFKENGNFDLAIIWSLPKSLTKEKLEEDLLGQNKCPEIIVLSDYVQFSRLPEYKLINDVKELHNSSILRESLRRLSRPCIYCAYIAAAIYPTKFNINMMIESLLSKFPELQKMHPKGRGSGLVGALQQMRPQLVEQMDGDNYRWDNDLNPEFAIGDITYIMTDKFQLELPDSNIIDKFKKADLY